MTSISSKEYREGKVTPKRSKYGAKRTLLDGILFDSKAEACFYAFLKQREKANEVSDIKRQHKYDLMVNGVLIASYIADFVFFDRKVKAYRVVDVKGFVTRDFRLKAKLMKACFGIEVEVVK